MQALLHYFLRTRGEGHTQLMARSIARELTSSFNSIVVWMWTMAEAESVRRAVRVELELDGQHMTASVVDRYLARVKWCSASGGSVMAGFRAPAFVDNHVVIELAADLDRTKTELGRARDVIGHQEQKLDEWQDAHDLVWRANNHLRQRVIELRETITAQETELAVLRAKLDDVE